jgi:hypothetical protein
VNLVRCAVKDLKVGLQEAGTALGALAGPLTCNNPSCLNMEGPSEAALVSGRNCVCAGCKVARYCCGACQKEHWKQHKPVCAALKAAANDADAAQAAANAAAGQADDDNDCEDSQRCSPATQMRRFTATMRVMATAAATGAK